MCLCSFLLHLGISIKLDFLKLISSNEVKNFFLKVKLDLATFYFRISKENTKYKSHNSSMKFSITGLPELPQILTCMEASLNTPFPIP